VPRTLVIGGTGGIGGALVAALRGTEVTALTRKTAPRLDLTDEASIEAAAAALRLSGPFDRIIDATGALTIDGVGPEKRLADLDPAIMARAFAVNAIGPALLIKHFAELLPRQGRSVFATLSARVGSIGDNHLGGWYSYRASKAALNQLLRTASIEVARRRPQALLLALHPGTVQTPLSKPFVTPGQAIAPEEAARRLLQVMEAATASGIFLDHAGLPIPW
jgi:NAD(P)-dependent dehydrogenase (short-subunit alcohol dehydrogenase family)